MRRPAAAVLLILCAGIGAPASAAPAAVSSGAADVADVSIRLDREDLTARLGQKFEFTSTVSNNGDQPLDHVVAHLNVLGLDPSIYVDPEDWSSERTQFIDTLPAGESEELSWEVQAVSPGNLAIYVTATSQQRDDSVAASKALRVSVAQARKLNAGGSAPLVLGVPAAVVLLVILASVRRRSLR
jgi:uncharacterized membrane protein